MFEYLTHHPELIAGSTAADPLWHNFAKLTPDKNGTLRTAKQWLAVSYIALTSSLNIDFFFINLQYFNNLIQSWQKRVFTAKQNSAAKKPTLLDEKTFDLLAHAERMKAKQPPAPSNIASAVAPHEPVKMANLDRPIPTLLDRKTFDLLAFAEKIKTEQPPLPSNIVNAVAPYEPVNMSNLDIGMQASLQNSELSSNKQKLHQPTEDEVVQYLFNNCNSNPDLLKQMICQTLNLNNYQEKSHVPEEKLLIEDQEKSAMQKGGEDGENGEDEEDEEYEEDEEDEPEIPEMEVKETDENNPPMCQCPSYELLQSEYTCIIITSSRLFLSLIIFYTIHFFFLQPFSRKTVCTTQKCVKQSE